MIVFGRAVDTCMLLYYVYVYVTIEIERNWLYEKVHLSIAYQFEMSNR